MARDGVSLLALLLACCLSVPSLARDLDIPQSGDANREFSQFAVSLSFLAETGHDKGVSVSSILHHEAGHEENKPIHATGPEKINILQSALHPKPELVFNDKVMALASLLHNEQMSLLSISRAEDMPFSHSEEMPLPILSHSEDILLYESPFILHDDDTIPSVLVQNSLPIGLLPSSVASYSITDDGKFTISLQNACYVKFDYEVYYAQTITGKVSYGTITNVSGIQAKEAFLWVPVMGVRIDTSSSEYIYFDAGPISKKLSISQFQTIPVCKVKAFSALK